MVSPGVILLLALLVMVVLAGGLALWGLSRAIGGGDKLDERLETYAEVPQERYQPDMNRRNTRILKLRIRVNNLLSNFTSEELNIQLASANWPISAPEYILLRVLITGVAFLLGWLLSGMILPGVGLGLIAYLVMGFYMTRSIHQRQKQFSNQLIDVLVLINGAVRAGFSLLQAMDVVVREMKAPASLEFERVQREVGLGVPLAQALDHLAARMQNQDLDMLVAAIKIQYQVGGNMTTMLQSVTETIRERIQLFSEVRVITTQQRYTSYLLTVLPFFVGGLLFVMNPQYMSGLFTRQMVCVPAGAVILIIIGNIVIRRLGRIEV